MALSKYDNETQHQDIPQSQPWKEFHQRYQKEAFDLIWSLRRSFGKSERKEEGKKEK